MEAEEVPACMLFPSMVMLDVSWAITVGLLCVYSKAVIRMGGYYVDSMLSACWISSLSQSAR